VHVVKHTLANVFGPNGISFHLDQGAGDVVRGSISYGCVGCSYYKRNVPEFVFVDTGIGCLWMLSTIFLATLIRFTNN
jgi:hypothetical protein